MKPERTSDQAAREGFRDDLATNYCVIAGAGSGKTTAVVDRICSLAVQQPDRLPNLIVVTYTNSAAVEFRRRTRTRLVESLSRAQLLPCLRALRRSYFGTIHGYCLGLVQDYCGELR